MYDFDTNDPAAVSAAVDHLLFDIMTDPTGEYTEGMPHEPAAFAPKAPSAFEPIVIMTSSGPMRVAAEDIDSCQSRSQLRYAMYHLLEARMSNESSGDDFRQHLLFYTNKCMVRLNELSVIQGA